MQRYKKCDNRNHFKSIRSLESERKIQRGNERIRIHSGVSTTGNNVSYEKH